jgi:UDP-N-acetyl-D-mannosaminuronic acid dehydrogenase
MNDPKKILIKKNAKISDAINMLEKTGEKLLICTDLNKKFLGVLNDGDIRRAIIKKANVNEKIEKYINYNAITVNEEASQKESVKIISPEIMVLPIINKYENVIGYYSYKDKLKNFTTTSNEIAVVGVGYVGLTLSIVLSSCGFRVYGFDKNQKTISLLRKGNIPFYEKGLKKHLDFNNNKNLFFINKLNNISTVNTYIVCVGTPLNTSKSPILENLKKSITEISKILKKNDLIILRSTIPVGSIRKILVPILEKFSGLKVGHDFSISYAPERTAEGKALQELKQNPQIIGGWDELSVEKTAAIFNNITHSIIKAPDIESAELCKLIDNSYRDHQFAFINQFVPLCKKLKLNLSEIVDYVNHGYSRNHIAKPSPGVGGPCLSKDPYILKKIFDENNLKSNLFSQVRDINQNIINYLYKKIDKCIRTINNNNNKIKIFFIGIAFKGSPETSDYRNSTSLLLLEKLKKVLDKLKNVDINVFDPVISKKEIKKNNFKFSSIDKGFSNADIVIFFNNHESYLDLNIYKLIKKMKKPSFFFDMWSQFESIEIKKLKGVVYWGLGRQ